MSEHNPEIETMLASAEMSSQPSPVHMSQVKERMRTLTSVRPSRRPQRALVAAGMLLAGGAVAIAATRTGRDLVRWIFTPIETPQVITGENSDGSMWMVSRTATRAPRQEEAQPDGLPAPESAAAAPAMPAQGSVHAEMAEIEGLRKAGSGRLVALMESPDNLGCQIQYTLHDGRNRVVGEFAPTGMLAETTHFAEVMKMRDAGAGELVSTKPGTLGLGRYVIRLRLSDGQTLDLDTLYPPGPRAAREAIFAETRTLKKQLQFDVEFAHQPPPGAGNVVFGLLRYRLADGRTVGIVEQVPPEAVTPDGKYTRVPATGTPSAPVDTPEKK